MGDGDPTELAAVETETETESVRAWGLDDDLAKPQPPLLNGTYHIFYDWEHTTYRNNEHKGGGTGHWDDVGTSPDGWMAYSSACTGSECIATGTPMASPQKVMAGVNEPDVLRLVNGVWQDITPIRRQNACTYPDGTVAGSVWHTMTWSFEPRPDGTFEGTHTTSVDTDGCGDDGDTVLTPLVMTRIGP
jgi:hypothetical protein